jgi:cell division protein FtsI (penicillin-binding protein 3)
MTNFSGARAHKFTENPILELRLPAWRSRLIALSILACFAVLIGRAFYLQVLDNDFLQGKGESRYRRDLEISASRGRISDRHGKVLAVSTPTRAIWAIPAEARLSEDQMRQLAARLEMGVKDVARRLDSKSDRVFLKRRLSPEAGDKVAALKLPGIGQDNEYRRYYPTSETTAHLVGYTGVGDVVERKGQEAVEKGLGGAERMFERQLLGRPGSRSVIKDLRGQIVEDMGSIRMPLEGEDITLALDSKIQYIAYSQLKQAIEDFKARAGGVVVVDARTGEILALANWPSYNPNDFTQRTNENVRVRAFTDTYEPGSVMKPFTAALALETGKVRFDTVIDCSAGRLTLNGRTITDSSRHGPLSVAQTIQKSSNVCTAKIALMLAPEQMHRMYEAIGLGQVPGLGFPGEATGILNSWKSWQPIDQATMSYGHSLSLSLIQLARAYTVFAREGDLIPLTLIKSDGVPFPSRQVFSPQTAREVRAMLEMVTQPGGTAPRARIPGYRVAGKTGTAYKVEDRQYVRKYVASFAGFAPVSDPRLIVAIMIDEPASSAHSGGDVAPVFSRVMGGALRALGVAPDAPVIQAATGGGAGQSPWERL